MMSKTGFNWVKKGEKVATGTLTSPESLLEGFLPGHWNSKFHREGREARLLSATNIVNIPRPYLSGQAGWNFFRDSLWAGCLKTRRSLVLRVAQEVRNNGVGEREPKRGLKRGPRAIKKFWLCLRDSATYTLWAPPAHMFTFKPIVPLAIYSRPLLCIDFGLWFPYFIWCLQIFIYIYICTSCYFVGFGENGNFPNDHLWYFLIMISPGLEKRKQVGGQTKGRRKNCIPHIWRKASVNTEIQSD